MNLSRPILAAAAIALALAACGSDSKSATDTTSASKANTFVLTEWSVTAPTTKIGAGKLTITASNEGSETHELVIVRSADAASLPTKTDGSVDEDKIPESKKAGEIAGLAAGKSATKSFDLTAGTYVAFCNLVEDMGSGSMGGGTGNGGGGMGGGMGTSTSMAGGMGMHHVHYRLGMVTTFTVSG